MCSVYTQGCVFWEYFLYKKLEGIFLNKKIVILLVLCLSLLSAGTLNTVFNDPNQDQITTTVSSASFSITISGPIVIDGNAQLASQATPGGAGTSGNPYIIENYVIDCCYSGSTCFDIHNTDKYFTLNNVSISNCGTGIYFNNVTFGSIVNSNKTNDSTNGIALESSYYNN